VSRNCALGSNGERAVPCQLSPEACRRERTSVSWSCWPTTTACEARGRVTLENTGRSASCPAVALGGMPGAQAPVASSFREAAAAAAPGRVSAPHTVACLEDRG
jgi:hypothetical protein